MIATENNFQFHAGLIEATFKITEHQ